MRRLWSLYKTNVLDKQNLSPEAEAVVRDRFATYGAYKNADCPGFYWSGSAGDRGLRTCSHCLRTSAEPHPTITVSAVMEIL